jgi:hypothetical protein
MEHIRPNGLAQGYFCLTCGEASSMMGHNKGKCVPNPDLVKTLIYLNRGDTNMPTETLGQKLAATLDDLEKAKIEGLEKQANADREKIRKERLSLTRLKDDTIASLTASIVDGRVPLIKIKDYDRKKWVQEAVKGKAAHQDIWNELTSWARSNALHMKIEDAHDGVGIESWINLTVVPVRPGTRSMGLKEGLGVGDYRG